jgi:hypothetical protein
MEKDFVPCYAVVCCSFVMHKSLKNCSYIRNKYVWDMYSKGVMLPNELTGSISNDLANLYVWPGIVAL